MSAPNDSVRADNVGAHSASSRHTNSDLPPPPPAPPLMSSASAAAPAAAAPQSDAESRDKDLDKEKDKSSLSTTLTGTNNTNPPRTRRNMNNTSENAPSSSTHNSDLEKTTVPPAGAKGAANGTGQGKKAAKAKKPGFLARIVKMLVPCAGPSAAHPLELPESATATQGSSDALREKQGAPADTQEPVPGPSHPATTSAPAAPAPPALTTESSAVSGQDTSDLPLAQTSPIVINTSDDGDTALVPSTTQLLPAEETEGVTSGAVQAPGSTGEEGVQHHTVHVHHTGTSEGSGDEEYEDADGSGGDGDSHGEVEDEEDRLIRQGGAGFPIGPDGVPKPLLPPIAPHHAGRKCLVLDLDETLVHSSFKSIQQADYIVPVEIDHHWHNFYVLKRPGVDEFLREMGLIYEVVVFTASLSVYADPVLDKLDIHQAVTHRLFRESCYNHKGNYVKDLSQLGREMKDTIILDNSPASYIFHPNNAVPVSSWFNDPHDTELTDMSPFLADLTATDDIRVVLDASL